MANIAVFAKVLAGIDKVGFQIRRFLDANACGKLCQADADHRLTSNCRTIAIASSAVLAFGTRINRPPDLTVTAGGSSELAAATNCSTIAGLGEGSAFFDQGGIEHGASLALMC
uniref:hypothetical protein n=1 Tax=Rhizobium sp. F40D2 TaxID=3453141 RepID=UPI003F23F663